jgi:hypothetical protein
MPEDGKSSKSSRLECQKICGPLPVKVYLELADFMSAPESSFELAVAACAFLKTKRLKILFSNTAVGHWIIAAFRSRRTFWRARELLAAALAPRKVAKAIDRALHECSVKRGRASAMRIIAANYRAFPIFLLIVTMRAGRQTMTDEPAKTSKYTDYWRAQINDFDSIRVIRMAEAYIIWLDKDSEIQWRTTDQYEQRPVADRQKFDAIYADAAVLTTTPCYGLSEEAERHFKKLIGDALWFNFEVDYKNANRMLSEARTYFRLRSEEISRYWYLSASAVMAAIMIALGLWIWIWREPIMLALTANFVWLCLAAVAGSCGALLSVIWRSGQLKFDSSAGRTLHYLEGISRIWAGALSGVVVALALKSGFILAPLTRGENTMTVIMLAAFAAGAGERLATSIISTFESAQPASASP